MLIWTGIKKRRAAKAEQARAAAAGSFTPPAPLPMNLRNPQLEASHG
jgi:hypothetical protein